MDSVIIPDQNCVAIHVNILHTRLRASQILLWDLLVIQRLKAKATDCVQSVQVQISLTNKWCLFYTAPKNVNSTSN